MFSRIKSKLSGHVVKVLDLKKDMYLADGSSFLFPKYTDFLSEAMVLKSVPQYIFYSMFTKRYKILVIVK